MAEPTTAPVNEDMIRRSRESYDRDKGEAISDIIARLESGGTSLFREQIDRKKGARAQGKLAAGSKVASAISKKLKALRKRGPGLGGGT